MLVVANQNLAVFQWNGTTGDVLPDLKKIKSVVQKPGIHSFATHLEDLKSYLEPLLEGAKSLVPEEMWSSTPIFLRATGGMRLLDPIDQESILNRVRDYFKQSPFLFHNDWASVIPGSYEAIYAWVAVNYQSGKIDSINSQSTLGVMDMGGATTQTAFVGDDYLLNAMGGRYRVDILLARKNYHLFANSWSGCGLDEFRAGFNQFLIASEPSPISNLTSPCMNQGYSEPVSYNGTNYELNGAGNMEDCNAKIMLRLDNHGVPMLGYVGFAASYGPFVGISGFQYNALFFMGNQTNFSLDEFGQKVANYCSLPWDQTKTLYPNVDPTYLATYCFSGTYLFNLLTKQYRLSGSERNAITFSNLSWASGAMMHEADYLNMVSLDDKSYLQTASGIVLMIFCCLVFLISLSLFLLVLLAYLFPRTFGMRLSKSFGFLAKPDQSTGIQLSTAPNLETTTSSTMNQ